MKLLLFTILLLIASCSGSQPATKVSTKIISITVLEEDAAAPVPSVVKVMEYPVFL